MINGIDKEVQDNGIECFGIDEFALKKGHNYAVALINPLKDRYLLKRANENVTDKEYLRLLEHFGKSSYLEIAYELKEEFRDIFMLDNKKEAMEAFQCWCAKVKENKIKEFKKVINTVTNWYEQIFYWKNIKSDQGIL